MSRTDAHTPYRVRVARREIAVRAVHRCAGVTCDLPALDPGWTIGRIGRCYWEFNYTGTNVCSCWMCHWHHRPEVRRRQSVPLGPEPATHRNARGCNCKVSGNLSASVLAGWGMPWQTN